MLALSGVSVLDVLSLPPRHLLWAAALRALAQNYPEAAEQAAFVNGAEYAVTAIFELLAERKFGALRGLLHEELLQDLATWEASAEEEGWAAPPELLNVKILGLLSAEGLEAETGSRSRGRALRVTPLVYSRERYTYRAESERTTLVHQLRRWTFERELEAGSHWVVVDMGTKHWCWQKAVP